MYFFDTDDKGFGSCWLVKKCKYPFKFHSFILISIALSFPGSKEDSIWDASHVVKTSFEQGGNVKYKLTSTVLLTLKSKNDNQGTIDVAGNVEKTKEN